MLDAIVRGVLVWLLIIVAAVIICGRRGEGPDDWIAIVAGLVAVTAAVCGIGFLHG